MIHSAPAQSRFWRWCVLVLAALVPLLFAAFTHHVWEDYYITLRSSRNLVEGHGLVFQPGERLHTFTSPLGVLLPAVCTWLARGKEDLALWFFRLANITLLGAAAALVWRRVTLLGLGPVGLVTLFGLLLLDPKLADFSTNGQETAILLFFTLFLWSELERPARRRPIPLGLAYAGLMWSRPDAFILAGAITLPHLIWRGNDSEARAGSWKVVATGVLIGILIYAPWVAWTTYYYGSPIPHTIVAKGTQTPPLHVVDVLLIPVRALGSRSMLDYLFLPTNFLFGGWSHWVRVFAHGLTILAAFGWLVPSVPLVGKRTSFAIFIGMFYLCSILLFAWYVPPWTALATIAIAFAMDAAFKACVAKPLPIWARTSRVVAMLMVAFQFCLLTAVTWQMHLQQRIIEDHGRREIGEWLRLESLAGESVFLEPLGYIGYFSNLKTYDFPGLSSREVVAAIRGGASRYADIVARLRPTWLVLRPNELAQGGFPANGQIEGYRMVREWNAQPQLDSVMYLPGRGWLEHDARFLVYRRIP